VSKPPGAQAPKQAPRYSSSKRLHVHTSSPCITVETRRRRQAANGEWVRTGASLHLDATPGSLGPSECCLAFNRKNTCAETSEGDRGAPLPVRGARRVHPDQGPSMRPALIRPPPRLAPPKGGDEGGGHAAWGRVSPCHPSPPTSSNRQETGARGFCGPPRPPGSTRLPG